MIRIEDEIELIEEDIARLQDRLDSISKQVPMCAKCGKTDLKEEAYLYVCKTCRHRTAKIAIKYKRIPK